MVFGVFDGMHEGHRAFFREAKMQGDYLIAVVSPDEHVERLKGHLPGVNLAKRFAALEREDGVNEVVIGDEELGSWAVVKKYRPEIIALGYDQTMLKVHLESALPQFDWHPIVKIMNSFEPNRYKSSLLSN